LILLIIEGFAAFGYARGKIDEAKLLVATFGGCTWRKSKLPT
jgi:hypothetical protein